MSNILQIFLDMLQNPHAEQSYRKIKSFYLSSKMHEEAEAIQHLIDKKFGEKHATPTDDPHPGEG